jgi:hypothetical protein
MASQKTLIGRAVERATLGRLLNAVRGADSRVLVLRGEPGVGKTALLDDAIGSASDLRVLRAVGVESEMELAFAALHQLCAPVLDRLGRLPGPQQAALRVAFGLSGGEAPDRFLVGLAALSLLSEVAEEPAGQGRLGVAVDRQGAAAGAGEPRRQVDRGDRLADSAVLVGDGQDDRHGLPPHRPGVSAIEARRARAWSGRWRRDVARPRGPDVARSAASVMASRFTKSLLDCLVCWVQATLVVPRSGCRIQAAGAPQ